MAGNTTRFGLRHLVAVLLSVEMFIRLVPTANASIGTFHHRLLDQSIADRVFRLLNVSRFQVGAAKSDEYILVAFPRFAAEAFFVVKSPAGCAGDLCSGALVDLSKDNVLYSGMYDIASFKSSNIGSRSQIVIKTDASCVRFQFSYIYNGPPNTLLKQNLKSDLEVKSTYGLAACDVDRD